MDLTIHPGGLRGDITVPPSKSEAHRALIAAALANGRSIIENVDLSSDIRATLEACRALGCAVKTAQSGKYHTLTVEGPLSPPQNAVIDCAESGSTLRFLIPVACLTPGTRTFTGRGRLPQRPIDAYLMIFDAQGISYTRPPGANLPLTVSGSLSSGCFRVDGRVSSQFVTGLLLSLPRLTGDSGIQVLGGFESRGYVDMTVGVLRRFGVTVTCEDNNFFIRGNQSYLPQRFAVEGDYSQGAFFLVAGAISGGMRVHGLSPDSLQPDRVIVDLLQRMGADISREGNALTVRRSKLHGIDIDVSQCPDLVPPLAIAAAFAQGITRITGAARLRIKESDRLAAIAYNLAAVGVKAEEQLDGLTIHGGSVAGGSVDSFGDHRIAMAFSIAAAASRQGIRVTGTQCVDKSYPGFYEDFAALGGNLS